MLNASYTHLTGSYSLKKIKAPCTLTSLLSWNYREQVASYQNIRGNTIIIEERSCPVNQGPLYSSIITDWIILSKWQLTRALACLDNSVIPQTREPDRGAGPSISYKSSAIKPATILIIDYVLFLDLKAWPPESVTSFKIMKSTSQ
jgi:hypothetical protein